MGNLDLDDLMKRAEKQRESSSRHTPYEELTGERPDFRVHYRLDIDPELGQIKIRQGIRSDFLYEGDDPVKDGVYMIWPEFLDDEGNVVTDATIEMPQEGFANMWIGLDEGRKKVHRSRIKEGVCGYWVVGSKK